MRLPVWALSLLSVSVTHPVPDEWLALFSVCFTEQTVQAFVRTTCTADVSLPAPIVSALASASRDDMGEIVGLDTPVTVSMSFNSEYSALYVALDGVAVEGAIWMEYFAPAAGSAQSAEYAASAMMRTISVELKMRRRTVTIELLCDDELDVA
jgi:hypothetical protein